MITVCPLDQCTGCKACCEICPKKSISISDSIKSYNAVINEDSCIKCNLCHNVCPINNPPHFARPKKWYQGWTNNAELRASCSSGGFASSLATEFISNGGVVCSCCFFNGEFSFKIAKAVEQVRIFKGSKYVKSDPQVAYSLISDSLKKGSKVLFIGLPCQVAGLKKVIKDDNFYTIDLICHGTPSPEILRNFLNEHNVSVTQIEEISFRENNNYHLSVNQCRIEPEGITDDYTYAFLKALDFTENCYHCIYAKLERCSDITLGDSWGTDISTDEQGKGISLLLCNTERGEELLKLIKSFLYPVSLEKAVQFNRQLRMPSKKPQERKRFLAYYFKTRSFKKAIKMCSPKFYYKQRIKKILIKLHILSNK